MSDSGTVCNKCVTCGKEFSADEVICPDDGGILVAAKRDPAIGTILAGKYEIEDVIGGGGMGVVYKAKHLLMHRTVAIKMLLPETVSNEYALARFQKEAQAAASLNHPNILTIHDFGISENKQPYLVMDYLKGQTLADVLENEEYLHLQRALSIFIQIASALAHAHQQGVVHRDLKPANIMLVEYEGKGDFVKIVDFGIAKTVHREGGKTVELTQTGQVFGSPLYMSPEQCRGVHLDARSDIYSIGCVMYRSVTGTSPFRGQDALELMFKHVNETPEKFSQCVASLKIPENFESVVFKCLAKDPENRYQTMSDLRKDLESVAGTSINSPFIFPTGEADASKTPKIGSLDAQRTTLNEYIAQTESQKQKAEEIEIAQSKLNAEKAALKAKVIAAAAATGGTAKSPADAEASVLSQTTAVDASAVRAALVEGTVAPTGPKAAAPIPDPVSITTSNSVSAGSSSPAAVAGSTIGSTGAANKGTAAGSGMPGVLGAPSASSSPDSVSPSPRPTISGPAGLAGSSAGAFHPVKHGKLSISKPQDLLAPHNRKYLLAIAGGVVLIPLAVILLQTISNHKPTFSTTSGVGPNTAPVGGQENFGKSEAADELKVGSDAYYKGSYIQAKDALKRASSMAVLNKNLPVEYQSALLLGEIDLAEGNYDGAKASLYAVVNAFTHEAEKDRPTSTQAAEAYNGLGVIATNQGSFPRAHEQFKAAFALRQKLPPKDADVAETLMGMGTLALYEHNYKQALDFLTKARTSSEAINGADHSDTAHILNDMGQAYQFLGKYSEADDCYKKALAIRQKNLNPGDPQIASTKMCMAALAFKKRDYATSERLFQDALAIDSKALGTDNLVISQIYFSLGVLYQEQKKFGPAADYYQRALDIQKNKLDPSSPKLAHTKQLLNQVEAKRRR